MRGLIRLAARLYPRAWRRRYGVEFAALIEDSGFGWRVLLDVVKEGMAMRFRAVDFRIVAACVLAGAAVAGVVAWKTPDRFWSTAVGEFGAEAGPAALEGALGRAGLADRKDVHIVRLPVAGKTVFSLRTEGTDAGETQKVAASMIARLNARVLDPASLPDGPFYPNRPVMIATGMAGGLVLGGGVALFRNARVAAAGHG